MKNQATNVYKALLSILCFTALAACNNKIEKNSDLNNDFQPQKQEITVHPSEITIDTAGIIPIFRHTSTSSIIYVHNNGNVKIDNIKYFISHNSTTEKNENHFTFGDNCSSIAAHSVCALEFTTPNLSMLLGPQSALLNATYIHDNQEYKFSQFIEYQVVNNADDEQLLADEAVVIDSNDFTNPADRKITLYVYGGGIDQSYEILDYNEINTKILDNNIIGKTIQSHEVRAIEVDAPHDDSPNASLSMLVRNKATGTIKTTELAITSLPVGGGPILTSGSAPLLQVPSTTTGQMTILNSGNSNAVITTISASTPPNNSTINLLTSGINRCIPGSTILLPNTSCNIYFSVDLIGSNSTISVNYTNTSGSISKSFYNNVTWYNSINSVVVSQVSAPAAAVFNNLESTNLVITIKNIGGFDLNSMVAESPVILSGSATATLVSPGLSCSAGSGSLKANNIGSCTYTISVADNVNETNKSIMLGVHGNFTNDSGNNSYYSRSIIVSYSSLVPLIKSTWMTGSNSKDQPGVYSGSPALLTPGARYGAYMWKDKLNNFWLFAGYSQASGYFRDFWKYTRSTNQWTLISGNGTINQLGSYGTIGIEATTNIPGSRNAGSTWTDESGNLWLFGGFGYPASGGRGFLNDLWKYNMASGRWVWLSGSSTINQTANYGTKGVESTTNVPGARYDSANWIDESGNLWLFGGYGCSASSCTLYFNDLWRYNRSNNRWTWISGNNTTNSLGNYGTKGVEASTNMPGARSGMGSWIDEAGNLWIFGGYGYNSSSPGYLNDLWKYNRSNNRWTWVSGSNGINQAGTYGTKGTGSSVTIPPGNFKTLSWQDIAGNFWLFGGFNSSNYFNYFWRYSIKTNQWTWVGGSNGVNQLGNYGTKVVESSTNVPGARYYHVGVVDESSNLWLFGGYGYGPSGTPGSLNDLWRNVFY